jgi:hypothetical protein
MQAMTITVKVNSMSLTMPIMKPPSTGMIPQKLGSHLVRNPGMVSDETIYGA